MINPQPLQSHPTQPLVFHPNASNHFPPQPPKPVHHPFPQHSSSQSKPSSSYPSRLRIHSHHQPPHRPSDNLAASRYLNLQKLKIKQTPTLAFKQSNGIMNQPPDYLSNKYTFKNDFDTTRVSEDDSRPSVTCVFGACCSMLKETQKEVYLSPTQLITMGYFNKGKADPKSLKINNTNNNTSKHIGSSNSINQKSFFKDRSNVIE